MIAIFPDITRCAETNCGEKLALTVRKRFDSGRSHRLDISQLLNNIGILPTIQNGDHKSWIVGRDSKGKFEVSIGVSAELSEAEQRFRQAVLLGRYYFEIEPGIIENSYGQAFGLAEDDDLQTRFSADKEGSRACDVFAASLLVPRPLAKRASEQLQSEERLGAFFAVPPLLIRWWIQWLTRDSNIVEAHESRALERGLNSSQAAIKSSGMARIRQIAGSIDKSVDNWK